MPQKFNRAGAPRRWGEGLVHLAAWVDPPSTQPLYPLVLYTITSSLVRPLIIVEETALRKLLLEAVFLGRQERTYRRRKSAEGKSQQYDTIFRVSRSSGRVSVEETDRQVFQSPSGKLLRTSFPDEFSLR